MKTTSPHGDALRRALEHPTSGVVGLVDDLLAVCRDHGLELDWQTDRLRVRSAGGAWEELLDAPLRKTVFRAILARVAVLCNEQRANSVSPYGGQCEMSIGGNSARIFHLSFANTPDEQKLSLVPAHSGAPDQAAASVRVDQDRLPRLNLEPGQSGQR